MEQRLLGEALIASAGMRLGLWLLRFRTLSGRVDRFARRQSRRKRKSPPAERIAWAVQAASRYVPQSTCLVRALTLQVMLGTYGHPSRLQIGIAKDEKRPIEAHAWVELSGQIFFGGIEVDRYRPLLHQRESEQRGAESVIEEAARRL